MNEKNGTAAPSGHVEASKPPAVSLPKGGGAIGGTGEKFAAHPVTGTGSMSVPIATSPGRSGFGPQLSLSYDSGAGNDPSASAGASRFQGDVPKSNENSLMGVALRTGKLLTMCTYGGFAEQSATIRSVTPEHPTGG